MNKNLTWYQKLWLMWLYSERNVLQVNIKNLRLSINSGLYEISPDDYEELRELCQQENKLNGKIFHWENL